MAGTVKPTPKGLPFFSGEMQNVNLDYAAKLFI
jgi:hypothetical protein